MKFVCPSCSFRDDLLVVGVRDCFLTFKCPSCNIVCQISPAYILRNALYVLAAMLIFWLSYLPLAWLVADISLQPQLFFIPFMAGTMAVLLISKYRPVLIVGHSTARGVSALYAGIAYGVFAYVLLESVCAPLVMTQLFRFDQYRVMFLVIFLPLLVVPSGVGLFLLHKLLWNLMLNIWQINAGRKHPSA